MQNSFTVKNIKYTFDIENASIVVENGAKVWKQVADFDASIVIPVGEDKLKTLFFNRAKKVKKELFEDGISFGLKCEYSDFELDGKIYDSAYVTVIWVHKTTGRIYFDLIPVKENTNISYVNWPAPFNFVRTDEKAYSILPCHQGALIPSNMPVDYKHAGLMNFTEASHPMPWYGQLDNGNGYQAIVETRWDANHWFYHKGDSSAPTWCQVIWMPSLGKVGYTRRLRVEFFENASYVSLAKEYRKYIIKNGDFVTLEQKALANPRIRDMAGCPVIHSEISFYIKPEARIYNKKDPSYNNRFHTFEERRLQIEALAKKGLRKAYMHLDGWGVDGYDQQHPDIIPPHEKAGGVEGLKALKETCNKNNIIFALHDQYRDYYWDASSYEEKNAVKDVHGKLPHDCTWNGGDQNFLCQTLHEHYIDRNYDMLEEMGFKPDGVYLDVYAASRLDECSDPMHPMTKKDCMYLRRKCMASLGSRGIIISSECGVDAFAPTMVLCHHAPYRAEYSSKGRFVEEFGIEVPLLNLVYHDSFMIPWMLRVGYDKKNELPEHRFLDAMLNGGAGYLAIDSDEEDIKKVDELSALHEKVIFAEMTNHEFLSDDYKVQRTTFSNGIKVTVDYNAETYKIEE